jgi:zinc transporter ZupT
MIYLLPLLSVVFGYAIALILKPTNKKSLKLLLAFSGSFLLSLTVLHLLPEVYESAAHAHEGHDHGHNNPIGIFIMAGIVFQIILEYFSKGAEHGHVHVHGSDHLHKMPWLLFLSLCIHAGKPPSWHGVGYRNTPLPYCNHSNSLFYKFRS